MNQLTNIAILLFSRSAGQEIRHKSWLNQSSFNLHIARHLIDTTRTTLSNAGLPVFHLDESLQKGHTFGERLANAFQDIYSQGFDAVISVGNDASCLDRINWKIIADELSAGRNVLGPDFRKGVYLIGLTKASFDQNAFSGLSWQKSTLFEELNAFCNAPVLLPKSRDLNTRYDLTILSKISISVRKLLQLLTDTTSGICSHPRLSEISWPSGGDALRGPPAH